MPIDVEAIRRAFLKELHAVDPPPTKLNLRSYLGSPVPVLGLGASQLRGILGSFGRTHQRVTAAEVNTLAAALWPGETFEEKASRSAF